MFCRAKIGVVLILAGTLTGWAAPLSLEQKNPASLRDGFDSATVLKPSQGKAKIGSKPGWRGVKVHKIIPAANPAAKLKQGGVTLTKAAAGMPQPAVSLPATVIKP